MDSASAAAVSAVRDFINANPEDTFELIEWVCFDDRTLAAYREAIRGMVM